MPQSARSCPAARVAKARGFCSVVLGRRGTLHELRLDADPLAQLRGETRILDFVLVSLGGTDQNLRLPGLAHLRAVKAAEVAPISDHGHLVQTDWEGL